MTNIEQTAKITIKTGDVYMMQFDGTNSEQKGWRPGVIVSNNIGNLHSPNVIALPLTSSIKKLHMPTHILIDATTAGLRYDSMVICENPKCISKSSLGSYLTTLSPDIMHDIAIGFLAAVSALSFLDHNALLSSWKESIRLNTVA